MADTNANEPIRATAVDEVGSGDSGVMEVPTTPGGIARQLGPGLIIAASIVGSGELIATTKTGAQAGIALLWLIIVGCLIKVFVQIEFGRYSIGNGETTLSALNRVPGPRLIVNWIVWYWLIMMCVGFGQLGGIVGGVGQALAMAVPIDGDYVAAVRIPAEPELKRYIAWSDDAASGGSALARLSEEQRRRVERSQQVVSDRLAKLDTFEAGKSDEIVGLVRTLIEAEGAGDSDAVKDAKLAVNSVLKPTTKDDKYWAVAVTLMTIILLVRGRYGMLQNVSTVLVVGFTIVTFGNVISLQLKPEFALSASEFIGGLFPGLPEAGVAPPGLTGWKISRPVATALATFGIIGVGASELIGYPYWCLEKGYAKYTGQGKRDDAWYVRANGWIRVMKYDAYFSMIIYTIATLAFFVMGVAVMYRQGLDPEGMRMVSTLAEQYVPVFGEYAKWLFLIGAIAVLYSTYLVANAMFARVYTDAFKVYGLMKPGNPKTHDRSVMILSATFPLISMSIYCLGFNPVTLVVLGGFMQSVMLPMLGIAALYFRFRLTDERLRPGKFWDVCLILSAIGMLISGAWGVYSKLLS